MVLYLYRTVTLKLKKKAPRLQAQCAGQLSLEAPEHPSGYQKPSLGPVCLITCISYGLANIGFESSNVLSAFAARASYETDIDVQLRGVHLQTKCNAGFQ